MNFNKSVFRRRLLDLSICQSAGWFCFFPFGQLFHAQGRAPGSRLELEEKRESECCAVHSRFLIFVSSRGGDIALADLSTAFLFAEVVSLEVVLLLPNIKYPDGSRVYIKLRKVLSGLRSASLAWYKLLSELVREMDWKLARLRRRSSLDTSSSKVRTTTASC